MSVWEKLAVSTPLNKTAAVVTGASRHDMPVGAKIHAHHAQAETPWPTIPVAIHQEDLTGLAYDRATVVGYVGRLSKQKGATGRWAIRCACGKYEHRSAKTIRERKAGRCADCEHNSHLREIYSTAGKPSQALEGAKS